jgi:cytochrome c
LDFREQGEQMMVRDLMIGAVVLAASAGQTLAQDLTAGEASFRKCQPCHDIGETAKNKLGPELNGLDGRKAGTVENGTYSQGMKNSGITWNEQAFREFVSDLPQAVWSRRQEAKSMSLERVTQEAVAQH